MELVTPRLRLREFSLDDHAAVHAFASDQMVVRYTDWGPNRPADTAAFLREAAGCAHARPRSTFTLAVVERADGMLIGSIHLSVLSAQHRRAEMGYVLARSRWGHGYATEAATVMLSFGFAGLGLHKVSATCDPANTASARVLTKIGMQPEGRLRDHLHIRGRWHDRLAFAAIAGRR